MTRFCAFPGCDNPASPKAAGGLCNSHYWQRHKGRDLTPLSYRRNRCVPWLEAHVDHDDDDCLIWPFAHKGNGYGQVGYRGKMYPASRLMCIFAHGQPPTPKHQAAHSCGRGHEGCVNPRHLRWATDKENKADMLLHGTRVRGETIPWSVLTAEQVRQIRSSGGSQPEIAAMFGIKPGHVGKILRREIWRHV